MERDPATGELTVLAEFITGSRLSDLLEATADAAIVPGVDVALGYLLEALPALTPLHTIGGITHGLIDASRTVLTPDGQVVFLDLAFGSAVEGLNLSRQRLWTGFGVASPRRRRRSALRRRVRHRAGGARRASRSCSAATSGRTNTPTLCPRSSWKSSRSRRFAAPRASRPACSVSSSDRCRSRDAGLRHGRRGGSPTFDSWCAARSASTSVGRPSSISRRRWTRLLLARRPMTTGRECLPIELAAARSAATHSPRVPELHAFLQTFKKPAPAEPTAPATVLQPGRLPGDATDDDSNETEISLNLLESAHEPTPERDPEEIYDLPPLDEVMAEANMLAAAPHSHGAATGTAGLTRLLRKRAVGERRRNVPEGRRVLPGRGNHRRGGASGAARSHPMNRQACASRMIRRCRAGGGEPTSLVVGSALAVSAARRHIKRKHRSRSRTKIRPVTRRNVSSRSPRGRGKTSYARPRRVRSCRHRRFHRSPRVR